MREHKPILTIKADAKEVEEKFGGCADVYARTRAEAAELAGDGPEARHWEKIANSVSHKGSQ